MYCWSFFQLSSRRASTCSMNRSRSFDAGGACWPEAIRADGASISRAITAASRLIGKPKIAPEDTGLVEDRWRPPSGDARQFAHDNARRLVVVALVPP